MGGKQARMADANDVLRDVGAIDSDVHIPPPEAALLPYLDAYWRETVVTRGIGGLDLSSLPPADGGCVDGNEGARRLEREVFAPYGSRIAICHCLHGAQALQNEDLAAALVTAVNDWVAAEWLDRDSRLRASILVNPQHPARAVQEIERRAADDRFVAVVMPSAAQQPLGKRVYWPIYEAAARHGMAVVIHAGGLNLQAPTTIGWPEYIVEDYVGHAMTFQSQLISLVAEGVLAEYPSLNIVCAESGFTWLPGFLWRINKLWRGLRAEFPWVDRPPGEIIQERVRFTLQPTDAPADPDIFMRVLEQMGGAGMLLFSTDHPNRQFAPGKPVPACLPADFVRRMAVANPLETYERLGRSFS